MTFREAVNIGTQIQDINGVWWIVFRKMTSSDEVLAFEQEDESRYRIFSAKEVYGLAEKPSNVEYLWIKRQEKIQKEFSE